MVAAKRLFSSARLRNKVRSRRRTCNGTWGGPTNTIPAPEPSPRSARRIRGACRAQDDLRPPPAAGIACLAEFTQAIRAHRCGQSLIVACQIENENGLVQDLLVLARAAVTGGRRESARCVQDRRNRAAGGRCARRGGADAGLCR